MNTFDYSMFITVAVLMVIYLAFIFILFLNELGKKNELDRKIQELNDAKSDRDITG